MIYLSIPNYSDPQNPSLRITAYALITNISVDFLRGKGRITLGVYRTLEAMMATPPVQLMGTITIPTGGTVLGGSRDGVTFPTLTQFASDEATEWNNFWQYVFDKVILMEGLTAATIVRS